MSPIKIILSRLKLFSGMCKYLFIDLILLDQTYNGGSLLYLSITGKDIQYSIRLFGTTVAVYVASFM